MKFLKTFAAAGGIAVALSALAGGALAEDAYYKGKTIRFIVGFGAGGGYDAYSRLLAPHFQKVLGASVVVENQPGAGGMVALNRFSVAPANGLQMTIVNGTGASLQQLLEVKGARYDLTKFKVLGTVDNPQWIFLMAPKSPYNTLADVVKAGKRLTWGGSGKVSGTSDGAAMSCYTLKLQCKVITGYKGSRASALALAQGEIDGLYVSETSAFDYVKSKNAKAIANWNRKRSKLFPDLPTVFEQLPDLTADQKWWIDYRATVESLGRVLVAPPSTPKAQLDALRAATHKILSDPAIVAEGDKKRRYINYIPWQQTEKNIEGALSSVPADRKALVKKVVLTMY